MGQDAIRQAAKRRQIHSLGREPQEYEPIKDQAPKERQILPAASAAGVGALRSHDASSNASASAGETTRTLRTSDPKRWPKWVRSPVTRRSAPAAMAAARIGASLF